MAKTSVKPSRKGTLVRGADGNLYFIPDSKIQVFSVPSEGIAETDAELVKWAARRKKGALEAVRGIKGFHEIIILPPRRTLGRRKARSK